MTMRLVAGLVMVWALATASPAAADPAPRGLPQGWTMLDDAAYSTAAKRDGYAPPPSRRGTYAYGEGDLINDAADLDPAANKKCGIAYGPPRADLPPATQYWYFEAEGEGVLLLQKNEIAGYDAACKPQIRTRYSVERAMIGRESFTLFTGSAAGWIGKTRRFADFRNDEINDIRIGNGWGPLQYFVMRKRRLSDSDTGGRIGKVATHCITFSSPPDFGGYQCWVAGPGPGKGIVTTDLLIEIGSPVRFHQVHEMEDNIAIDARLFEWDRPITHG